MTGHTASSAVLDFLRQLSEAPGLPGHERAIADIVEAAWRPLVDDIRRDALGSVIAVKRGEGPEPRPKLMLATHMDEIGLIVTAIEDGGFLRFTNMGGVDRRISFAQEVTVHGRNGPLAGIIGAKPPHVTSAADRGKPVKLEDQFIDVGLPEDEVRRLVRPGDLVTFSRRFLELQGGHVAGKALDDRASVAAVYDALLRLQHMRHTADVYAVATVQEEVGLRGAFTSTYGIMPDIGVAIDVGFGDSPGQSDADTIELGQGPAAMRGPNVHPVLEQTLAELAAADGIPCQTEAVPGDSGTDAWAMQVTQSGVPTAVLSIPLRYMHTTVEVARMDDIHATGRLLARLALAVDRSLLERLVDPLDV